MSALIWADELPAAVNTDTEVDEANLPYVLSEVP